MAIKKSELYSSLWASCDGLTLDQLLSVPGMGLAKSGQTLSTFELARRYLIKETMKLERATDVLPLVADIGSKSQEHFVCITLNGANELIESASLRWAYWIAARCIRARFLPTS